MMSIVVEEDGPGTGEWFFKDRAPLPTEGNAGDIWVHRATGIVYQRYATRGWVAVMNVSPQPPSPLQPTTLVKISGDNQSGQEGQPVLAPLVVEVRDQFGSPMQGVGVVFAVTAGGGVISSAVVLSNTLGRATSLAWTLGAPGTNVVAATIAGVPPVTFSATAAPVSAPAIPVPSSFVIVSGNQQSAEVGTVLAPIVVRVRDQFGANMANVPVAASVVSGGGSIAPASAATDSAGVVSFTPTLGGAAGANQFRLEVIGRPQVVVAISATAIVDQVAAPVATIDAVTGAVTLTSATSEAVIRYTTDGSAPTANSTLYSAPFTLSAPATVRAFAALAGMTDSAITSTPFTNPDGGVALPFGTAGIVALQRPRRSVGTPPPAPQLPVWSAIAPLNLTAGSAGSYTLPVAGATGVTFGPGSPAPAWLSLAQQAAGVFVLSWSGAQTPNDDLSGVVLRASNQFGSSDSAAFGINVDAPATSVTTNVLPAQYAMSDSNVGWNPPEDRAGAPKGGTIMQSNGATRAHWKNKLNPWGDWIDANLVQNGATPYASLADVGAPDVWIEVPNVGPLVKRQLDRSEWRGLYLRIAGSAWAFRFGGRNSATPPTLIVLTNIGEFVCPCVCSAWWTTSFAPLDGRTEFQLSQDQSRAVLQFDMSAVNGRVISARLRLRCFGSFSSGNSARGTVQVMEADPPGWRIKSWPVEPQKVGLAQSYPGDAGIGAHPSVIVAGDFAASSPMRSRAAPPGPNISYVLNPETGRTAQLLRCPAGQMEGTEGWRVELATPTVEGRPSALVPEVYVRVRARFRESWISFAGHHKFLGFDARYGYRSGNGNWQPIGGNSGAYATGRIVNNTANNNTNTGAGAGKAYDGHSARGTVAAVANRDSDSPLKDFMPFGYYTYWLGQGAQPPGTPQGLSYGDGTVHTDPRLLPPVGGHIQAGAWLGRVFEFETRIRMNTINLGASPDADGNRDANTDGELDQWVAGVAGAQRRGLSWTRNALFRGVQAVWASLYQGGGPSEAPPADTFMEWIDVVVATERIGPYVPALPSWRPAAGQRAIVQCANSWDDADPGNGPYRVGTSDEWGKVMDDFSGGVLNPEWGEQGMLLVHGGGHSASNDNSVAGLDLNDLRWKLVADPSRDAANIGPSSAPTFPGFDREYGEHYPAGNPSSLAERKPGSAHTYDMLVWVPPHIHDAEFGSLVRPASSAVHAQVSMETYWAHKLKIRTNDLSTEASRRANYWSRASNNGWRPFGLNTDPGADSALNFGNAGGCSDFDPTRNRIWWFGAPSATPAKIIALDLKASQHLVFTFPPSATHGGYNIDTPIMRYVRARDWLVVIGTRPAEGNAVRGAVFDCSNPTAGWTPMTFTGASIPGGAAATPFDVVPPLNKLCLLSPGDTGAVYDIAIPLTRTGNWVVTRQALPGGQTIESHYVVGKRWAYSEAARCIIFKPRAALPSRSSFYAYTPVGL